MSTIHDLRSPRYPAAILRMLARQSIAQYRETHPVTPESIAAAKAAADAERAPAVSALSEYQRHDIARRIEILLDEIGLEQVIVRARNLAAIREVR